MVVNSGQNVHRILIKNIRQSGTCLKKLHYVIVSFRNAVRVQANIAMGSMNVARRLDFGDALLPAPFSISCPLISFFLTKRNMLFCTYHFPALRVRRPETRLTVYWVLS